MKKWLLVIMMGIVILTVAACDEATISSMDGVPGTRIYTPRVEGQHRLDDYEVVTIGSREALDAYIEDTTSYNFSPTSLEETVDFITFVEHFDDAYFKSNVLIFVVMDEFSQSLRHRLADVHLDNGQLRLHVERFIPPTFVEALGSWHLVIELDRDTYTYEDVEVLVTTYQEMAYDNGFYAVRTPASYGDVNEGLVIIETYEALMDYLETHGETFNFTSAFGGRPEFIDTIEGYDESYFDTGKLAFVVVVEGSGSNYHRFIGPRFIDDDTLELRFERVIPFIGTADIATWHLIVELDKEEHTAIDIVPRFTNTYLDDES